MPMNMDLQTEDLTEQQWQIAHAIAQALVKDGTDVNELGKAIAYLRSIVNYPDAVARFFKYLKTLVGHGKQVSYSSRTLNYYRSLDIACSKYLKQESLDAPTILHILSWSSRLVRYYKTSPIGERSEESSSPASKITTVESQRQQEIKAAVKAQTIEVGQVLEAQITAIKGKDVTYLILDTVKLTVKEPKKADSLTVGETVKVQVTQIREDNVPKKVKFVDSL